MISVYATQTGLQDKLGQERQLLPSCLGRLLGRGEKGTAASYTASCCSQQACGTMGLKSRGSTRPESVAWILALSRSKSGLTWPLESESQAREHHKSLRSEVDLCAASPIHVRATPPLSFHSTSKRKELDQSPDSPADQTKPQAPCSPSYCQLCCQRRPLVQFQQDAWWPAMRKSWPAIRKVRRLSWQHSKEAGLDRPKMAGAMTGNP